MKEAIFDIGEYQERQRQALLGGDNERYKTNLRSAMQLLEPIIQRIEREHPAVADRLRAEIEMSPLERY